MRSMSGGYGADPDLRSELAKRDDNIDVLKRRLDDMVKIPPPALGGSIVDLASVYTSEYVGLQWPSGSSELGFGAVSYATEYKVGDTSWLSVSAGDIAVTEDGFYQAWCYVDLRWSSQAVAPGPSLSVYLNGDPTAPGNGAAYYPIHQAGTLWGVVTYVTNGPEYLTAGQYWRLEADGSANSSAAITKSSAAWRITKYA